MIKIVAVGSLISILISLLSYCSQFILIKNYGYSARGIFEILGSVLAIVSTIFSFNYYTAINIFKAKNGGLPGNHKYIDAGIGFIQITVCLIVIYIMWDQFAKFSNLLIISLLACILLNHIGNIGTASMNGTGLFLKSKIISIPGYLVSIRCISYYKNLDLQLATVIVFSLPFIIPGLYNIIYYWNNIDFFNKSTINLKLGNFIGENIPIYIISISQIISQKFFIIWCTKTEELDVIGAYGFSLSLVQFILMPATFMATIILSQKKYEKKLFNKMMNYAFMYLFLSIVSIVFIFNSNLFDIKFLSIFKNINLINNMKLIMPASPFMLITILQIAKYISLNKVSNRIIISQVSSIFILIIVYEFSKVYADVKSPMSLSFLITSIILCLFSIPANNEN